MDDFLKKNIGSKEPGMVIVETQELISTVVDLLFGYTYELAPRAVFLSSEDTKTMRMIVTEKELSTQADKFYDVLVAMVTGGQKNYSLNSTWSLVLVCTKTFLEEEQHKGRNWLSLCGLTFNLIE